MRAVVTAADFPDIPSEEAFVGEGPMNFRDLSRNCMARDKALYEGHAVAAVAAISQAICDQALELIDVKYEVLPYVIDVEAAMADDAPVLHEDLFTANLEPKPTKPSNIAKRVYFHKGNVEDGFKQAEVIVEGHYTTEPVHQAYIEPHACLCSYGADGQSRSTAPARATSWCAPMWRSCWGSTSPTSAARRPRSAAGSAARRWCISSRWRLRCPRSAAGR